MNQNKKVIAITGGIGSGKSSACEILSDWGYPIVSCDDLGREVAEYSEVVEKIKNEFGEEFVSDGKIDRKALRECVFKDQEKTDKLNEIFHAEVGKLLKKKLDNIDFPIVFVEVSVPKGLPKGLVDETWEITADSETRRKRVMFRDNVRSDQIRDIMARQNYKSESDAVIDNNGYIDDLKAKLKEQLTSEKIKAD